jgi:hypothetical protein
LQALERFAEAEEAFRRAITVADTKSGCDERDVAQVLTFMLVGYERQNTSDGCSAVHPSTNFSCEDHRTVV